MAVLAVLTGGPAVSALPWSAADLDLQDLRELQRALDRLGVALPEVMGLALDDFDPETARRVWAGVQRALQEASLEDLAELQPAVRALWQEARRRPRFAPYAVWLEARMDYFDEARRVVSTPAPPRPPAPPSTRPLPRPPPTTRPSPPKSPSARASDPLIWRVRVARRPKPAAADRVVPALKTVFRRNRIPEALAWLAEVESSLNPAARSPAGAVGLFQLMPATARHLGVNPDGNPDERLDPLKNADAASRYLGYLYRRFRSWPLALAAYNAGEGRVARLLRETGGADYDAIAARLPLETRMYVPHVLETIRAREGLDPASLPPPG